MEDKIRLLTSELGENRVQYNIDISDQLQTGLGGVVGAFYIATDTRELIRIVELCRELRLKFLIIGSGSKVAIPDDGFKGVVIKNRSDNLKIFGIKGKVSRDGIGIEEAFLEADSGSSLIKTADYAIKQGLGGLEGLRSPIGTLGGSFYVNPILREKVTQVKVLSKMGDSEEKEVLEVDRDDIILSVIFKLKAKKV